LDRSSSGAYGQFIPLNPLIDGRGARLMRGVLLVQPRHDYGSIDENHGRVFFNSSVPEQ
jgi:hypothetical protein